MLKQKAGSWKKQTVSSKTVLFVLLVLFVLSVLFVLLVLFVLSVLLVLLVPLRPHKHNRLVRNHPNSLLNRDCLIRRNILEVIRAAARPDDLDAGNLLGFAQAEG